ncbi:transcription factor TRY [Carex littledalei]|uniref:Transcription factor TRY n=1 Tax=Carex littledalei TaxID=544730 RepID=A0A833QWV2_9POAL|nr:transcription factor TRY [Carex littledalei]
MYKRRQQQPKAQQQKEKVSDFEEVTSIKWEMINMTDQEEDLIYRMYRLVGDRWSLIAGRIPGRKPEEIERFWIMKHGEGFAHKREVSKDWWRRN